MPDPTERESPAATEVVTFGEAMQLLVAEPGIVLRRATSFRASVAGAETNVAVGLARLGHRASWLGRLGADQSGAAVLSTLRAEGVDTSAVEVEQEGYTGLLMRDSHPVRGIEVQYFRTGSAAAALSEGYVRGAFERDKALGAARLVHVSGITPMLSSSAEQATKALFAIAAERGALVSFDPNIRHRLGTPDQWRATLTPLLGRADFVFAGADELELITGRTGPRAVEELMLAGTRTVLVKNRDRSCTVTTAEGQWHQPTLVGTVVDPVGAGDAVVSGYLSAWLRGEPAPDALFDGVLSAALVVGAVTDIEGLPDRTELAQARRVGGAREGVHR
jgi:2-dehydro-3-deoxygluconokinase